ncbi:hypothetical protein JAAARDRAFT_74767 [Jaapia argillacea MUCL 33604]|uniref:Uncharacterized protein n=1 Tax=Jaapia argillacea MUCL 33604 TaxID=933084 RepID=A0A067P343_9AGAM|nr:hypothetical protein JAAARDRAFT_74767 [Jaapia argillacea MUCL 33604]
MVRDERCRCLEAKPRYDDKQASHLPGGSMAQSCPIPYISILRQFLSFIPNLGPSVDHPAAQSLDPGSSMIIPDHTITRYCKSNTFPALIVEQDDFSTMRPSYLFLRARHAHTPRCPSVANYATATHKHRESRSSPVGHGIPTSDPFPHALSHVSPEHGNHPIANASGALVNNDGCRQLALHANIRTLSPVLRHRLPVFLQAQNNQVVQMALL